MNEKLNMQDLSAMLVSKHLLTKEEADNFIKEFFSLIENALERERYVKIRGLGVFKLIEVEPRESVNINTKERFEIPGYTKISFTPDNTLRDVINKPFAHFETVVLNENVVFDENAGQKISNQPIAENGKIEEYQEDLINESVREMQVNNNRNDENRIDRLHAREVYKRKSKIKLYAVFVGLLVMLFGGILFFTNRYRLASEKWKGNNDFGMEVGNNSEQVSDIFSIDSTIGEKNEEKNLMSDTIHLFVSETPLNRHVED